MKKIYILLTFLLPFLSLAQPTITGNDLPVAGLAFIMGTDSAYTAAIPSGGPNQTWDYTSLQNLQPDTSGFASAVGTPYASQFPGSNLASHNPYTDQWAYFTSGTSGFYIDGIASTTGVFRLNPGQLFAPVPFTYGNTRNHTARIQVDSTISGINYRLIETIASSFVADGFGTLNLPSGNYNNTLRVKNTELTTDSILVDPLGIGIYTFLSASSTQLTHYRWFHNGAAGYLMGIDADSLGTTSTSSEYLITYAVLSAHDPESNLSSYSIYPNPASEVVNIDNDFSEATLVITNSLGQEVERKVVTGKKQIETDVKNYSEGLYLFTLFSGTEKRSGKFIIQH